MDDPDLHHASIVISAKSKLSVETVQELLASGWTFHEDPVRWERNY